LTIESGNRPRLMGCCSHAAGWDKRTCSTFRHLGTIACTGAALMQPHVNTLVQSLV
jgi:hypothetical protein